MSLAHTLRRPIHLPGGQLLRRGLGLIAPNLHPGWRSVIAASALPAPLARTVTHVIRRTRLRPSERAEIAQELCAHFTDALARGQSLGDTLLAFGDPDAAATLIRRATLRKRHWLWRFARPATRAVAVTIAILLLGFGSFAWRFYTREPWVAMDYVGLWNARTSKVPESDRAWPAYREASLALARLARANCTDNSNRVHERLKERPWTPAWDRAKADAIQAAPLLSAIRTAAAKPMIGAPLGISVDPDVSEALWGSSGGQFDNVVDWRRIGVQPGGPLWTQEVLLPHLGLMSRLAAWIELDFWAAVEEGDRDRAMANIHALLGMANQLTRDPPPGWNTSGASYVMSATSSIIEAIVRYPGFMRDQELANLSGTLAATDLAGDTDRANEQQRQMYADTLQRLYTNDANGDGQLTPAGQRLLDELLWMHGLVEHPRSNTFANVIAPLRSTLHPSRLEAMEILDSAMQTRRHWFEVPSWERDEYPGGLFPQSHIDVTKSRPTPKPTMSLLARAMQRQSALSTLNAESCTFQRDATLVAIALERHRLAHAVWPASLDGIDPAFRVAVPRDIFDGKPLRYALIDHAPVLYSGGPDRLDDHGNPIKVNTDNLRWCSPAEFSIQNREGRLAGDWILFRGTPAAPALPTSPPRP